MAAIRSNNKGSNNRMKTANMSLNLSKTFISMIGSPLIHNFFVDNRDRLFKLNQKTIKKWQKKIELIVLHFLFFII